ARWRPHVKTAKLAATMRELVAQGVKQFKCATTLELKVACETGAEDVLIAFPMRAANARRAADIARRHPRARVSALVEDAPGVAEWGGEVGLFWDLNPGMDRTGAALDLAALEAGLAAMREHGSEFRGLHYYDGHLGSLAPAERMAAAQRGYDELVALAKALERDGQTVGEIVTAGTPALPCSLAHAGLRSGAWTHRVSPGTVVYNDVTSLEQLPEAYGYRPAALVLARVVSRPAAQIVTCDAGHKAVSADCGVPNCVALGHPELRGLKPSEEHLPWAVAEGEAGPRRGELLRLLPRHVCPTVNNFDHALWIEGGRVQRVESVTARGHDAPLGEAAGES
ncbi:MAG: D-TA family PLP-dependent enzyme, partial [Terriglobales bacterium]